jgi:hypothetical protein
LIFQDVDFINLNLNVGSYTSVNATKL